MRKIYGILVAVLILSAMIQMTSASGEKDYTCVDKAAVKTPPPIQTSMKAENNVEKTPLCSEGKVPRSTIALKISDTDTNSAEAYMNVPKEGSSETASCSSGRCYDWAYSRQIVYNTGASVFMTQHNPAIDSVNGIYSVGNMYVSDGSNRVLTGWTKSKNDYTRLGTSWWRYNAVQDCGYYGCDFVQTSNYYYPGMYLGETSYGIYYSILYYNGDWWISYNGDWLGYYPGSLWGYTFNYANEIVYRGGVASTTSVSTTDMGNGLWSSNYGAAKMTSQRYNDLYGYSYSASTTKTATSSNLYSVTSTGNDGMRYGGPGSTGSSITVVTPNGGENWPRATTKRIQWSYTGSPGSYVKIELLKGGYLNSVITYSTYNDGSFDWVIPSGQALGSDYKVRITSTSNSAYKDTSNNNFIISSNTISPSIRVISPNGGENWARGSTKLITWTKTGNPGAYVRIQLYKSGVLVRTISSSTYNDGSFSWPIPWTQAIGSDYKIKISSTTTSYNDWSNSNFRIY